MKRLLSTLLLIVMLTQALPVNALAAVGKVLSKEDEITHGCQQIESIMLYAMSNKVQFIKQVFNVDVDGDSVDLFGCVVAKHNIRTQHKYIPVIDLKRIKELFSKYPLNSVATIIPHLAKFVSRLWQIHAFGEGNTRTTAVFFILYLRTMGFDVTNDIFAENAWYFRNSLVRANYNNYTKGIRETSEYLELFLRNLLLGDMDGINI